MRIVISTLVVLLSCLLRGNARQLSVDVTNPASFDRPLETIEIPWKEVQTRLSCSVRDEVEVLEGGNRLLSQKIDYQRNDLENVIVFQAAFHAHERKHFIVRRTDSGLKDSSVTDAKYVLPRKDIAWENDRIAYRIYGGPLAGDVRSGIDVWVKRVRYRIIDKWYDGDSLRGKRRISYHVDHGEGADYFLVGRSLGAGGCALWKDNMLDQAGFFTSFRIMATGPIRTVFTVRYESDSTSRQSYVEEMLCTLDAGMNLNKIEVRYPGVEDTTLRIALGLVKRENTISESNQREGWLSLWGPVDSIASHGSLGLGIVISPASLAEVREDSDHYLIIAPATSHSGLTYYAGAGWTGSGDFKSADDWKAYLSQVARSLQYPMNVAISGDTGK